MSNLKDAMEKFESTLEPIDFKEYEQKMLELGVNIKNEDGTYKKFIDVLEETSKKFNEKVEENNAD